MNMSAVICTEDAHLSVKNAVNASVNDKTRCDRHRCHIIRFGCCEQQHECVSSLTDLILLLIQWLFSVPSFPFLGHK